MINPLMKPVNAQSSDKLQWLGFKIGHQYSSSQNGHQDDMPHCGHIIILTFLCLHHLALAPGVIAA